MKDRENKNSEEGKGDAWRRLGRLVGLTGHIFDQETKKRLKDAKIADDIIDGIIQEKIEETEQDENSTDKS